MDSILGAALLLALAGCAGRRESGDLPPRVDDAGSDPMADPDSRPIGPDAATTARCHDRKCLIPAGKFVMGSPHDEPLRGRVDEEQRPVTLTRPFLVDQYERTQGEWVAAGFPNQAGRGTNGSGGRDCTEPSCPAAGMTWLEAALYVNELSKREGRQECLELIDCTGIVGTDYLCKAIQQTTPSYYECTGYRLPTLYEFQYMARAGTMTAFYSGPFDPSGDSCVPIDHLMKNAWYCANSENHTHPVGGLLPNAWGLYDILGNAGEMGASPPDKNTTDLGPQTDPGAVLDSEGRVSSPGGFYFNEPGYLRVAAQWAYMRATLPQRKATSGVGLGFRVVRTMPLSEAYAW